MAQRDPQSSFNGCGDTFTDKLTGHRSDWMKTTPREGPGDCSWLKVTHVNHVSAEAPTYTPRRSASNSVAGKVVESGGPKLRSPNASFGKCRGPESAPAS